jgi:20S proteasome alpha/beta subunit
MDPLYTNSLIAGIDAGQPFLAYLDLYGIYLTGAYHVTGFAHYIGKPILVNKWREGMTEEEAHALIEEVMRVLWLRDSRAGNRVQFAKVTANGVEFGEPYVIQVNDHDSMLTAGLNPNYP